MRAGFTRMVGVLGLGATVGLVVGRLVADDRYLLAVLAAALSLVLVLRREEEA